MATTLTARGIESAKATGTPRYISDAMISGLALYVSPSGVKTWSVRYRMGRRLRRLTLGDYPTLSLAEARERARAALKVAGDGVDPALDKQERRDADTVGDFATTYIERYAKPRKKSWKVDEMRLRLDVLPTWRYRLMRDITRRDVRELLDAKAIAAPIVANRLRSLLHKVFNVAIQEEVVDVNPVTATRRPGIERPRDRVLTLDEIRTFWAGCEALPLEMSASWTLRLLTAARGGEVLGMRWADLDLAAAWWTIPSTTSKNRLAHRIPLSAPVLELLKALRLRADASKSTSDLVLRGARGARQQAEAVASFKIQDFRGHDLRRTAASTMASSGISRLVISKLLNHVDRSVTAVYDRFSYDDAKRSALDAWALKLDAIVKEKPGTVLPFSARA